MVPMIDSRAVKIDKEFKETKERERERERALHEKRLNPLKAFEIKYDCTTSENKQKKLLSSLLHSRVCYCCVPIFINSTVDGDSFIAACSCESHIFLYFPFTSAYNVW
jgi:hypothetical protein